MLVVIGFPNKTEISLLDRGNRQSKHRYLNIVNRKADNQLTRLKSALRSISLVSKRGILPRSREPTMVGIDKREPVLCLEHTPHPVGQASCPTTWQRVIGQMPKKAWTCALIFQCVNRRGHRRVIFARPDVQATTPPLISELITGIINLLRTNDGLCPPIRDQECTVWQCPGTHRAGGNSVPVFSRHSINYATTSP